MNVLMVIHPAVGPHNSTFCLAKLFQAAGDVVYYLVSENQGNIRNKVTAEGFGVVQMEDNKGTAGMSLQSLITGNDINLIVLDADRFEEAISLYRLDVPKLFINTTFASDRSDAAPPFTSRMIPWEGKLSRLAVRFLWARCLLAGQWRRYLDGSLFGRCKDGHEVKLAGDHGLDLGKFADHGRSWHYRLTMYPEFFLYPGELDFPRIKLDDGQYVLGPLVDLDRHEEGLDWSFLPNGNPVVYCSFGTIPHLYYPRYDRFLRKIIGIFGELTEFNLVLVTGSRYRNIRSDFKNVFLFERIPQLQVLRRAKLMIGHGGLNSIKECLHFGVPMVIYPIGTGSDQNGNSARVVYHGLGLRGNVRSDSAKRIRSKILRVYGDSRFSVKVKEFSELMARHKCNERSIVSSMKEIAAKAHGKTYYQQVQEF
jgi:zeaxanthin glucosyltransferase